MLMGSRNVIVYAHEVLRVILVKLFNSFLTHCFTPSIFSNVIFLPLLKDTRKSAEDVITIGRLPYYLNS